MKGQLICVVGASGSGKDSLMGYARSRLAGHARLAFAHRYITRAADSGGENHIALTAVEFAARRSAGLFALHWESNDHCYGIGVEIDAWLARGITVVINGSRQYLSQAALRYPGLEQVWITVPEPVLRARLAARGRESEAQIDARLARHRAAAPPASASTVLANDGQLAVAGERLVALLLASLTPAAEGACA